MAGGADQQILEIKQRLALIETRLQQLFDHLDVAPLRDARGGSGSGGGWWGSSADNDAISEEVRQLHAQGHKIEAVKKHREQTGLGLKEALEAVEALEA